MHQKGDQFVRLFAMDNSLLEGDVARPFLHKIVVEKQFVLYRNVRFFWENKIITAHFKGFLLQISEIWPTNIFLINLCWLRGMAQSARRGKPQSGVGAGSFVKLTMVCAWVWTSQVPVSRVISKDGWQRPNSIGESSIKSEECSVQIYKVAIHLALDIRGGGWVITVFDYFQNMGVLLWDKVLWHDIAV